MSRAVNHPRRYIHTAINNRKKTVQRGRDTYVHIHKYKMSIVTKFRGVAYLQKIKVITGVINICIMCNKWSYYVAFLFLACNSSRCRYVRGVELLIL